MDIKIQNLNLSLNDDEHIVCRPEKNKLDFYLSMLMIIVLTGVILFLFFYSDFKELYFCGPIFFILMFILYTVLSNYFFTDVILTNQRIIIVRYCKPISIWFNQLKSISGQHSERYSRHYQFSYMLLELKKLRSYLILFIDGKEFEKKFKLVYPVYDMRKIKTPQIIYYTIVGILLLLWGILSIPIH